MSKPEIEKHTCGSEHENEKMHASRNKRTRAYEPEYNMKVRNRETNKTEQYSRPDSVL